MSWSTYLVLFAIVALSISIHFWRTTSRTHAGVARMLPLETLPERLVQEGRWFEADGYGPMQGRGTAQGGNILLYKIALTDPTRTFDLRLACHANPEVPRAIAAVSWFPGGYLFTSNRVSGRLVSEETVQTLRNGKARDVIAAHQEVLLELNARGVAPMTLDPNEASARALREREEGVAATRNSLHIRLRHVRLLWRSMLHWPELRAPIRSSATLDTLARRLAP